MVKKNETKIEKLSKINSSFWTWATRSWYTRFVVGICLIILVIRLATTCVDMFGVKIGCTEGDTGFFESGEMYEDYRNPNDMYNHRKQ